MQEALVLSPATPNPSGRSFAFHLGPSEETTLTVRIYDARGRLVKTIHQGVLPSGTREIEWDARDSKGMAATAGVYFLRLESEKGARMERLVLVR